MFVKKKKKIQIVTTNEKVPLFSQSIKSSLIRFSFDGAMPMLSKSISLR